MVLVTYDDDNLNKHGITRVEIEEVFESDLTFAMDLNPSIRGNNRAMIIGWTFAGRLLEVGIEYFDDENREHVFHASNASTEYKNEFERRI